MRETELLCRPCCKPFFLWISFLWDLVFSPSGWDLAYCWWDLASLGWDLAEWFCVWLPMHQLQRSWLRTQHPSAQWNLRGGRWSNAEYCTNKKKKIPQKIFKKRDLVLSRQKTKIVFNYRIEIILFLNGFRLGRQEVQWRLPWWSLEPSPRTSNRAEDALINPLPNPNLNLNHLHWKKSIWQRWFHAACSLKILTRNFAPV